MSLRISNFEREILSAFDPASMSYADAGRSAISTQDSYNTSEYYHCLASRVFGGRVSFNRIFSDDEECLAVARRNAGKIEDKKTEVASDSDDDNLVPSDIAASVSNNGFFGDFIDKIKTFVQDNPIKSALTAAAVFLAGIAAASKRLRDAVKDVWNEGISWRTFVKSLTGPKRDMVAAQLEGLSSSSDPELVARGQLFKDQPPNVRDHIVSTLIDNWNDLEVKPRDELKKDAGGTVRYGLPSAFVEDFAKNYLVGSNVPAIRKGTQRWFAERITRRSLTQRAVAQQLASDGRFEFGYNPRILKFIAKEAIKMWTDGLKTDEKIRFIDISKKFDPHKLPQRFIDHFHKNSKSIIEEYVRNGFARVLAFILFCMFYPRLGEFMMRFVIKRWKRDIKRMRELGQSGIADEIEQMMKRAEEDEAAEKALGRLDHAQRRSLEDIANEIAKLPIQRVMSQLAKDKGFAKLEVDDPALLEHLAKKAIDEWPRMYSHAQALMILTDNPDIAHPEREVDRAVALQMARGWLPQRFIDQFVEWSDKAKFYIEKYRGQNSGGPGPNGGAGGASASNGGMTAGASGSGTGGTPPPASAMTMVPQVLSPAGAAIMFSNVPPVQWTVTQNMIAPFSMVYPFMPLMRAI